MTELPDLSQIPESQKDDLIRFLFAEVKRLTFLVETLSAQVASQSAKIVELEGRLSKNSHNSSKPPSSDGLSKKTRSLRESSGKKPGGQLGHQGSTLKRVANPTQIISHALPAQCDRCGVTLESADAQILERRQVIDIPISCADIIEHHTFALRCQCGRLHESAFPDNVTETVQYGPNVRALGVHLTQGQLLPFARAAELITDLYQLTISPATLVTWVSQARTALQSTFDLISHHLQHAPLLHVDESGLRVDGKLHWLHIVANDTHTYYGVHAKRGMDAIEAQAILPTYQGILVHDCWKPYWQLNCGHALCNAHLLRELVYVQEITQQHWPQQMINFLINASKITAATQAQKASLTQDDIAAFGTLYHAILQEGERLHPEAGKPLGKRGRAKQSIAFNLLRRLREHADAVLLFIANPLVPFTNNLAERAVRMPKVKQKISGCFRSFDGAEHFTVIRSCLDTMKKQGHRMLDVLRRAFNGNPVQPASC